MPMPFDINDIVYSNVDQEQGVVDFFHGGNVYGYRQLSTQKSYSVEDHHLELVRPSQWRDGDVILTLDEELVVCEVCPDLVRLKNKQGNIATFKSTIKDLVESLLSIGQLIERPGVRLHACQGSVSSASLPKKVCPDCKGTGIYRPLIRAPEACTTCLGQKWITT